jgi:DNA-binding transcriptional regulator YhcF (GntR family)
MTFRIDRTSKDSIYSQLVQYVEHGVRDGSLNPGDMLPSMNELAAQLDISRETVKKAYNILTSRSVIIPKQGKGFYISDPHTDQRPHVLLLFDKLSDYKQVLFNEFTRHLGNSAEITILVHNQDIDLLKYYLDIHLDKYDYYVLTPHFPLDKESQSLAVRQISRIPNRKLIMVDHLQPGVKGNFGAIYQDFENDIYNGLSQGLESLRQARLLRVITMPQSMYGPFVQKGVKRFTDTHSIPVEFRTTIPEDIRKGDCFLLLNSQLDAGLVELTRKIYEIGLVIGQDVRIISYNDVDMNELTLGGLTTVSTDFREMGKTVAEMILEGKMKKQICSFKMNRRKTF